MKQPDKGLRTMEPLDVLRWTEFSHNGLTGEDSAVDICAQEAEAFQCNNV